MFFQSEVIAVLKTVWKCLYVSVIVSSLGCFFIGSTYFVSKKWNPDSDSIISPLNWASKASVSVVNKVSVIYDGIEGVAPKKEKKTVNLVSSGIKQTDQG